ncbi:MAG: ADP-ribose pyrophosphatase YjhB (NUDIX family) [Gammaproteobacteria bacterium]|jgi:ADP-ribose pyrophosphatase YjhB (NUDIX family)
MATMNFCPTCATPLEAREEGGRSRLACPAPECRYIYFGDFSMGCSGVVVREENGVQKVLLIQRGQEPFAGTWQLPGGFAEHDEPLSLAVEREVLEEASVTARVRDAIAFRHMHGRSTNIYMIFRLDYVSGEPVSDGVETADAGFYSLADMAKIPGVQNVSRWGIEQALVTPSDSGLSLDETAPGAERPGWELYGLTGVEREIWQPMR